MARAMSSQATWCGGPGSPLCWCDRCHEWVRSNPDDQAVKDYRRRLEDWLAVHPGQDPETGRALSVSPEAYLLGVFGR